MKAAGDRAKEQDGGGVLRSALKKKEKRERGSVGKKEAAALAVMYIGSKGTDWVGNESRGPAAASGGMVRRRRRRREGCAALCVSGGGGVCIL